MLDTAKGTYKVVFTSPERKLPNDPGQYEVRAERAVIGGELTHQCFPDTVDPRGKKT